MLLRTGGGTPVSNFAFAAAADGTAPPGARLFVVVANLSGSSLTVGFSADFESGGLDLAIATGSTSVYQFVMAKNEDSTYTWIAVGTEVS